MRRKAPSNTANTDPELIKTAGSNHLASKGASKAMPAVLDGMDKAESLA